MSFASSAAVIGTFGTADVEVSDPYSLRLTGLREGDLLNDSGGLASAG